MLTILLFYRESYIIVLWGCWGIWKMCWVSLGLRHRSSGKRREHEKWAFVCARKIGWWMCVNALRVGYSWSEKSVDHGCKSSGSSVGNACDCLLKSLDKLPAIKFGLLYPFTIYHLQLEKQLGKPMNSIMLRIDMFALLRLLLFRMANCLNLNWM